MTELYDDIFCWLAANTPGEIRSKSFFKNYEKNVWNLIKNKFIELEHKAVLSNIQKEFLKCRYVGPAYRKICYRNRRKGQVYLINCYQSCSKTLNGLKNVSIHGDAILIQLFSRKESHSIDIIKLLLFMKKYNLIQYKDEFETNFRNINSLTRYIQEEEIVIVLSEENIKNISVINRNGLIMPLEKKQWYRNTLT